MWSSNILYQQVLNLNSFDDDNYILLLLLGIEEKLLIAKQVYN